MAYFNKEIYERKEEWAFRNQFNCFKIMADYIANEKGSIEKDSSEYDDIIEDLEVLSELCSERHIMHCMRRNDCRYWECFEVLGNQYSVEETLIDRVNEINKKYNLVPYYLEIPTIPEACGDDDFEYICEYYGIEYVEGDDDSVNNMLYEDWENCKDKVSDDIRKWFYRINEKYGTTFPDMAP